jgi:hypothetical protein
MLNTDKMVTDFGISKQTMLLPVTDNAAMHRQIFLNKIIVL